MKDRQPLTESSIIAVAEKAKDLQLHTDSEDEDDEDAKSDVDSDEVQWSVNGVSLGLRLLWPITHIRSIRTNSSTSVKY